VVAIAAVFLFLGPRLSSIGVGGGEGAKFGPQCAADCRYASSFFFLFFTDGHRVQKILFFFFFLFPRPLFTWCRKDDRLLSDCGRRLGAGGPVNLPFFPPLPLIAGGQMVFFFLPFSAVPVDYETSAWTHPGLLSVRRSEPACFFSSLPVPRRAGLFFFFRFSPDMGQMGPVVTVT